MGVSLTSWLYDSDAVPAATRAAAAWNRINDKPTSVVFKNAAGTLQAAQTVRIEYDNSTSESESAAGQTAVRKLVVFGIRGHATLTNTDIREGYRFVHDSDEYRCVSTILTIGEIQGIFEVIG